MEVKDRYLLAPSKLLFPPTHMPTLLSFTSQRNCLQAISIYIVVIVKKLKDDIPVILRIV
jgi:hypothetical protein